MKRFSLIILPALMMCVTTSASTAGRVADFTGIEKYVGGGTRPATPDAMTFMADENYYLKLNESHDKVLKCKTGSDAEEEVIFNAGHTRESQLKSIDGFILSKDESKLLVYTGKKMIYRRSFDAEYYIYDIRTRILTPLSKKYSRQQVPVFAPDGRMVAFVADNNVHIKKLDYGTEVDVTTDGERGTVINGVADWTYEEEFQTVCSMAWSPDNLTLCYLKYNETEVPAYTFPLYEGTCAPKKEYSLYPGEFTYKYPVAGQPNSIVTLHSYDVETRKTKDIAFQDQRIEYIPRIEYAHDPERLMVLTLNRDQNRMELYAVNPKSTVSRSVLVEESDAWILPATYQGMRFYPDFFVVNSSRTGWQQLYQYGYSGSLMKRLTTGDYDVDSYYGYNAERRTHYYRAASTGAINRVICSVDAKDRVKVLTPEQGYASATASPAMNYYVVEYSDVKNPPVYTLRSANTDKVVTTLVDNADLAREYGSDPKPEFFTMNSDGVTLNGYIIKPAGFDPSKRYPVVMYQYSGPESQQVLNRWVVDWQTYYARMGYVVACVDGRGTGGRGRKFMDVVYRNLGHYESIDQVNAARFMASLSYVDPARIGIFGWSYGGYEAIMAASQADAPYAAAVAVAPVTDWRYYDTVYAERYMLTPQQNESGYDSSSAFSHIPDLKCQLLIMSGTADDNVHFYNSIQYISALESYGKWCDLLIFPNMNHSINGCNSRAVVYARMLDYFNRNMR